MSPNGVEVGRGTNRNLSELDAADSGDALDPRPVVSHAHVDAGHVGVGAADAVRHGSHQRPPTVVAFHHQRTAAVALPNRPKKKQTNGFQEAAHGTATGWSRTCKS